MYKKKNYAKVYEIFFEKQKELNRKKLFELFHNELKLKTPISTTSGILYIKEIRSLKDTDIILFGKDNQDASNYKREKKKLEFEKININEKKEILTDFIHIAISKKYDTKRGSVKGCTILMEKSSLILISSFENFIKNIISNTMYISFSRRVITDFYDKIMNASRILEIIQTKKEQPLPLVNQDDYKDEKFTVSDNLVIKANPRQSLPYNLFKDLYSKLDKTDKEAKMSVRILDNHNNEIPIDFDQIEARYSIQYDIDINNRTDKIQDNIALQMNGYIFAENKG